MTAPTTTKAPARDDEPRGKAAGDPFDHDVLPTPPGATGTLLRSLLAPMRARVALTTLLLLVQQAAVQAGPLLVAYAIDEAVPLHQPMSVRLWPSSLLTSSLPALAPVPVKASSPALIVALAVVNRQRGATEPSMVTVPVLLVCASAGPAIAAVRTAEARINLRIMSCPFRFRWLRRRA